jgi:hypothetical protein
MTHRKWMAVAAFCLSLGIWITVAAPSILLAQQADENGQAMNPQPHTKKELKAEKKQEEHQDKAAYQQEKSANEAAKANQEAQKPN